MPHLAKYIVAVLLGTGVLLGGASLVDAHTPLWSYYQWKHHHITSSSGQCAYNCSVIGHGKSKYKAHVGCPQGDCYCKD